MDSELTNLFGPADDTTISFDSGAGIPLTQPSTTSTWNVTLSVISLLAFLFAGFVLWRLRTLRKELRLLASQVVDGYQPPSSRFRLPRFGLRTMLVLVTLVAVLLGTFGTELMRARRQARALEELDQSGEQGISVDAAYALGLLGDGALAQQMCYWVHPHFGCRVDRLALAPDADRYNPFSSTVPSHRIQGEIDLAPLAKFRDLEELQLYKVDLGEDSLQTIANLKKLRRLSLFDCRLPDHGVNEIAKLPNLQSLQLRHCGITDETLSGLQQMAELRQLDLSENPLTDAAAEQIATLQELTSLGLAGVKITGDALAKLATLEKLQSIDLQRTEVDLKGLEELTELASLRHLSLFGSQVGWELKPSEHKQAAALFGDPSTVELEWHNVNPGSLWRALDNRPNKAGRIDNPFEF